jgi:hypothetical protein
MRVLSYFAGDPGELDWHGEHVNLVDQPASRELVKELHAKVLDYIRLYPVDH